MHFHIEQRIKENQGICIFKAVSLKAISILSVKEEKGARGRGEWGSNRCKLDKQDEHLILEIPFVVCIFFSLLFLPLLFLLLCVFIIYISLRWECNYLYACWGLQEITGYVYQRILHADVEVNNTSTYNNMIHAYQLNDETYRDLRDIPELLTLVN